MAKHRIQVGFMVFKGKDLDKLVLSILEEAFDLNGFEDVSEIDPAVRTCQENPTVENLQKAMALIGEEVIYF